jgi:hypothetical protein
MGMIFINPVLEMEGPSSDLLALYFVLLRLPPTAIAQSDTL